LAMHSVIFSGGAGLIRRVNCSDPALFVTTTITVATTAKLAAIAADQGQTRHRPVIWLAPLDTRNSSSAYCRAVHWC